MGRRRKQDRRLFHALLPDRIVAAWWQRIDALLVDEAVSDTVVAAP